MAWYACQDVGQESMAQASCRELPGGKADGDQGEDYGGAPVHPDRDAVHAGE